jgi:hypothetical protein
MARGLKRRDYQYRLVWRREGDLHDRRKVFNAAQPTYKFITRLAMESPWRGAGKVFLRRSWAFLARRLQVPMAAVLGYSTRDAVQALRDNNPKLVWLRVEMRQVAPWVEMLNPLDILRTKNTAKAEARAEEYCDYLDTHPEKRWNPEAK